MRLIIKRHPIYTDYSVTNSGEVISHKRGKDRQLGHYTNGKGYRHVALSHNGKSVTVRVHRLVAETFIPNPHNLPQVNHIDEDKLNNCIDNLEWITARDNQIHSNGKHYIIEHIASGTIFEGKGLNLKCEELGISPPQLLRTKTGQRKHHKGYRLL